MSEQNPGSPNFLVKAWMDDPEAHLVFVIAIVTALGFGLVMFLSFNLFP